MEIFLDTCDLEAISKLKKMGLCDGVTTNPSIIAKAKVDFKTRIKEICDLVQGPVSAEVIATDVETMIKEGEELARLSEHVVVKLPLIESGLEVAHIFKQKGIRTNVTLCFSEGQALLAAKAGATYVSPFIGRIDDVGRSGLDMISNIMQIYFSQGFETKVLAASIRNISHVLEVAKYGVPAVTAPPNVIAQMVNHPLTDKGLKAFLDDWNKANV